MSPVPPAPRETEFEFDRLDSGRLLVNRQFRPVLEASGLVSFAAVFNMAGGEIVRAIDGRTTARILLPGAGGEVSFFLKRHQPPRLLERLRPLLHLSRPILGARNEWEAILRFHAAGIPTMTPVAFGESESCSLVMTHDLGTDRTLLDWANEAANEAGRDHGFEERTPADDELSRKRALLAHVAAIARRMHAAGLHHQDFYLNHFLCRGDPAGLDIRVIDLGRVQQRPRLSHRWIVKDLAQLDFSARRLSCGDRLRFLRLYLDRPFRPSDRWLIRQVMLKSRYIAAHTAKNNL